MLDLKEMGIMTELKIRNVDPAAICKVDDLAKRQGISRNELLKREIEHMMPSCIVLCIQSAISIYLILTI